MILSKETERSNRLFEDVFMGRIPERVPIMAHADNTFSLEYAGMSLLKEQYNLDKTLEAFEITSRDFESDTVLGGINRLPQMYKMLQAKNFVPGHDGVIQHPEVHSMEAEEYDEFISDPLKMICEKCLPRLYPALKQTGLKGHKAFMKSFFSFYSTMGKMSSGSMELANKLGKSVYSFGVVEAQAPFDLLADQLRSFTGISKDIRRMPDKVEEAVSALVPVLVKAGIASNSSRFFRTFMPLHMMPFLRTKDFERLYYPSFRKTVEAFDNQDVGATIFVEGDCMRFLDHLNDLPKGCLFIFEYGDIKTIKEKLGKKHIITGLFPVTALKTKTKQECIDIAKNIVDVCAPGGNFIFGFDKSILRLKDINTDNLKTVFSFVKNYGIY